jgi:signal transduction histidine kinase
MPSARWTAGTALTDLLIVGAVDVVTALPLIHLGHTPPGTWLLDQALLLPLLLRRRHPEAAFLLVSAVACVQLVVGARLPADAALLLALYAVAAHRPRRSALAAAGLLEAGVVLASVRFAPTGDGVIGSLVFLTGLVVAAFMLGTSGRTRREYLASVEDRAVRLEIERDQQARLGALAERTRIAREMHDIVAHHLSVMVTLAEGARAAQAASPADADMAIGQVATTGRQALTEMRQLLGVLRDTDPAAVGPQPGLGDVDSLIEQIRSTGLTVRKQSHGQPRALTTTAELTAYRAVQEALTNTLKHAAVPTAVCVTFDWAADELRLRVTNDETAPRSGQADSPGMGLTGMRERLAVHGGALTAGPGPGPSTGWVVAARLPYDPPAVNR